jgi:hypothetical protein
VDIFSQDFMRRDHNNSLEIHLTNYRAIAQLTDNWSWERKRTTWKAVRTDA